MQNNSKNLNKQLHDALLNFSENDSAQSKSLLDAAGLNSDIIISNSLNKIRKYEIELDRKTNTSLLNSIGTSINKLMISAPLQTNNFLQNYFTQNAPSIQFQATVPIKKTMLSQIKNEIDLNDLANKLEKREQDKDDQRDTIG